MNNVKKHTVKATKTNLTKIHPKTGEGTLCQQKTAVHRKGGHGIYRKRGRQTAGSGMGDNGFTGKVPKSYRRGGKTLPDTRMMGDRRKQNEGPTYRKRVLGLTGMEPTCGL